MADGYAANGGISLFSTRETGDTITSSDQGGDHILGGRILWWITNNGDNTFGGGITGSGWCREDYTEDNPFIRYADQQIWNIASRDGNLDTIFSEFQDIWMFASHVNRVHPDCMSGSPF